jgi:serine/threonine-protein kinase
VSSQLERLKNAFAGQYEIDREVGSGGMATVYLARDLKHDRQVATKLLRPELAAALGPDRFPREIRSDLAAGDLAAIDPDATKLRERRGLHA